MLIALRHPELVERLCVVDVSTRPLALDGDSPFARYVRGMRSLDLDRLPDRAAADQALVPYVADPVVRGFLLQNLRRDGDSWRWSMNLPVLGRDLDRIGDWPADELKAYEPYDGPVLWLAGERSNYVTDEYAPAMKEWFPRYRKVTIKGAGHWVHSEKPETFLAALRQFLGD
jgi:esterase